ncbi:topoisomerase DNA-binding C4 zinc finger domain-containing protein [archaeon]|nr:topoisomerase DNA-binding C4 zinc finger domain-containing protein [archaeon]
MPRRPRRPNATWRTSAPQDLCINPECKSKEIGDKDSRKEAAKVESGELEKPCPKCGTGKLVLRKSIYGSFYGCSTYPKCRYTQSVEGNGGKKKA